MAKGKSGRGNAGSRGQGNRGRSFRVIKPKKKRKGRRQLTNGVFGVPPELRPPWPAPVEPDLEDVEEDLGAADAHEGSSE